MTSVTPPPAGEEPAAAEVVAGLRAGKAVAIAGAYVIVQVAIGVAAGIAAVVFYVVSHGGRPPRQPSEALAAVLLPTAAASIVIGGAVILLLTALALRKTPRGFVDLGVCRATRREIASSAAWGAFLACLFLVLQWQIWPPPADHKWGPLATAAAAGGWHRGVWAVIALLAPPVEEFLFRGVLWTGLRRSFGGLAAGTIVTVAFVGSHATEALDYWPAWLAIAATAVSALAQRVRTGSLLPPVALHAAYNAVLVAAVYVSAV